MRYLAACLCQLSLVVCMAPLPSIGSEEQAGGIEEGIAKVVDRRSSPEIALRQRPSSRLVILPRRPSISADRATLVEARHPLLGHVLHNGLRAPLRC
jgi:hypothetical protein